MKKVIVLLLAGSFLSGCSYFRPHKMDVVQGNIYTNIATSRLRTGMSMGEVKSIMGNPVSVNIFNDNRIDYVYTIQPGHEDMMEKRITCAFQNGRLVQIERA
jgi:outer membrane protein assembly factor BamE